jgi:hypothetical protein
LKYFTFWLNCFFKLNVYYIVLRWHVSKTLLLFIQVFLKCVPIILWVMLTCALKHMLTIQIKKNLTLNKSKKLIFKKRILHKYKKKNSILNFLTCALKGTINISLIVFMTMKILLYVNVYFRVSRYNFTNLYFQWSKTKMNGVNASHWLVKI